MRRAVTFGLAAALLAAPAIARADDEAPHPDPADLGPGRPAEIPRPPSVIVPWERHIEFGPDLAYVTQLGSHDQTGAKSGMSYGPSLGFGVHGEWAMYRYLHLSLYFFNSNHELKVTNGALGLPGRITTDDVKTYAFGARLQPTLPLGRRARAWLSAGIGWQRFNFPRMEVSPSGGSCAAHAADATCYPLYDRSNSMAQFPLGGGAMFEIIPRWLSVQFEFTASVPAWQTGNGVDTLRAVDNVGHNREVGGLPLVDLTLVETLGVSLIL